MREIHCAHVLASPSASIQARRVIRINGERIAAVEEADGREPEPLLATPALANAHDHARPVRSSSFGATRKPLEAWLHWLMLIPSVDAYLAAAVSLARSALGGAGTVMVHYTRVQGLVNLPTEAVQVANAARDVGVRVGFAVALRDRNPLVYGPSEPIFATLRPDARTEIARRLTRAPLPVADQIALVDAVAAAAESPNFNVQYGPAAVQWCTPELLSAVAEASAHSGRRVHMHLLETRYQRDWADKTFPDGIVAYLDQIGLLSPRLALAHCTWARPAELELIAARGATIVVNTSSNLGLRSGIAPLAEMARRGCRIALGLDGMALDGDDDLLRELRLAHLLHAGTGFDLNVRPADVLAMMIDNGRRCVLDEEHGRALAAGEPADILLLDWHKLDDERLRADIDPMDLLLSRTTARHIHELIVAGRTVVRDGEILGVDFASLRDELLAQVRSGIAASTAFVSALGELDNAVAAHFTQAAACC
jgi:cytosine/adenosine deaminase-related metal-dependent hydrolase